jgi:excisionase family DNA binding protein
MTTATAELPPAEAPVETLLTHQDVARYLNVGLTKAKELCLTGQIKTIRIGGNVRVRARDLQAYIDSL